MSRRSDSDGPTFEAWYSGPIEKIRVHSTPGGVSLSIEQAEELREELREAILHARADVPEAEAEVEE